MQLIVVGAGGITRDLLRGLSEAWQVTVVDNDQERLDLLRDARSGETGNGSGRPAASAASAGETRLELGDGTSRVVLERAGLDRADAVVAAIGNDRANLEVCRIAKAAGVPRIAAVAAGPESINAYRSEDFVAFSPARLTARRLEIQLEPRRVSSAAFAEGMAQAIEFRIAADSPLVGRPLRELELERTLIAAISRRGALIVPHGATVLEEGDLVTVVCATADYPMVVRTFTTATARFPADFGSLIAVRLHSPEDLERLLPAAIHLVRNSAAEGLLLLHRPMGPNGEPEAKVSAREWRRRRRRGAGPGGGVRRALRGDARDPGPDPGGDRAGGGDHRNGGGAGVGLRGCRDRRGTRRSCRGCRPAPSGRPIRGGGAPARRAGPARRRAPGPGRGRRLSRPSWPRRARRMPGGPPRRRPLTLRCRPRLS